jgi:hypothetical protein
VPEGSGFHETPNSKSISEALSLRVKDADLASQNLFIHSGKGRKDRFYQKADFNLAILPRIRIRKGLPQ